MLQTMRLKVLRTHRNLWILFTWAVLTFCTPAISYGNEPKDIFSASVILGVNPLSLYKKSEIDPDNSYNGPIIDAHNHLVHDAFSEFLALSDKLGIKKIIAMGRPGSYRKWHTSTFANLPPTGPKISVLCSPDFIGHSHDGDLGKAQEELRVVDQVLQNC